MFHTATIAPATVTGRILSIVFAPTKDSHVGVMISTVTLCLSPTTYFMHWTDPCKMLFMSCLTQVATAYSTPLLLSLESSTGSFLVLNL